MILLKYDIGLLGKRHFMGSDLLSPLSKYFKASEPSILKWDFLEQAKGRSRLLEHGQKLFQYFLC